MRGDATLAAAAAFVESSPFAADPTKVAPISAAAITLDPYVLV